MMPASAVSSPVAVTLTRRLPSPLSVPAMTRSPDRLVDLGLAFGHLAVGGHARPRPYQYQVTLGQSASRDRLDIAIRPDAFGGVWHQPGQLVERSGCLAHAAHFDPVTQQHDVNQRHQLPEEAGVGAEEQSGQAVDEGHADCQRDEGHHAGLAVPQLGEGHLQEGQAAVKKDQDGKQRRDPQAAREGRHSEVEPRLQHRTVEQDRDAQRQTDPEAPAEQVFVTSMVNMSGAMPLVNDFSASSHGFFHGTMVHSPVHARALARPLRRVLFQRGMIRGHGGTVVLSVIHRLHPARHHGWII
jgi:hypothetical protein